MKWMHDKIDKTVLGYKTSKIWFDKNNIGFTRWANFACQKVYAMSNIYKSNVDS